MLPATYHAANLYPALRRVARILEVAFDPGAAGQAWFTGVGAYGGDTATIDTLHQPTGGGWPYAYGGAARLIVKNRWGSLRLLFLDCDNLTVGFDSERGYEKGTISLRRLTRTAGVACPCVSR